MSLTKEVHRLMKTVRRRTDGQVTVESFDCERDDLQTLTIEIVPNAGLYMGGKFTFEIQIPEDYPYDGRPSVWCVTEVFHPNIDTTETRCNDFSTNVCLNLLDYGTWDNGLGLEVLVHGLLFLMHNPNFDDPLSPFFESCDAEDGIENVNRYMAGEEIDGKVFELVLADTNKNDQGEVKKIAEEVDRSQTITGNDVSVKLAEAEDDVQSTDTTTQESGKETKIIEEELNADIEEKAVTGGEKVSESDEDEIENEEDEEKGGFRVVEIDGELILISEDQLEGADEEVDKTEEGENGIVENDVADTNEILPAAVVEENATHEHNKDTNDTTEQVPEQMIKQEFENKVTTDIFEGQSAFGPVCGNLCVSENKNPVEKVVKKIMANVQYIGGKVLKCLSDRYM